MLKGVRTDENEAFVGSEGTIPGYIENFNLIKSELLHDKNFVRYMDFKRYYLPELYEDISFKSNIFSIFVQMKDENTYYFADFMGYLYKKMDEIAKIDMEKFELYYPINIEELHEEIDTIRIGDITVELIEYTDIDKFHAEKLTKEMQSRNIDSSKYQYIKVTLYGRNVYYAESKATKYAQLIIGFLSFSKMYGVETYTYIGIPKQLIELELNCVFVFEDNEYLDSASFKDEISCNTYKIEKHHIENFNKILGAFNEANDNIIKEIICDSISCYYEGLIERNMSYSFLNFWKVIEILSLKDKEETHHKIVSRLKLIFTLSDIDSYSIDKIYELRNELVHSANNVNVTTVDRNLIKRFAETYTRFFLFKLSKLSHSDIKMQSLYFEYTEDNLEERKKAIDSVIKLKQKLTE